MKSIEFTNILLTFHALGRKQLCNGGHANFKHHKEFSLVLCSRVEKILKCWAWNRLITKRNHLLFMLKDGNDSVMLSITCLYIWQRLHSCFMIKDGNIYVTLSMKSRDFTKISLLNFQSWKSPKFVKNPCVISQLSSRFFEDFARYLQTRALTRSARSARKNRAS